MLEDTMAKIKAKQEEVDALRAQFKHERKQLFDSMVGKYYKTASTCFIKVDRIDAVDFDSVYIEGIVAYVYQKNFSCEVNFVGSETIRISNIEGSEITKEAFLNAIMINIEALKEKLIASDK